MGVVLHENPSNAKSNYDLKTGVSSFLFVEKQKKLYATPKKIYLDPHLINKFMNCVSFVSKLVFKVIKR